VSASSPVARRDRAAKLWDRASLQEAACRPDEGITRRALLLSSATALACGHRKATGFRGLCFVANQASRSLAVIDLTRFRVRGQIRLDAAPSAIVAHPTQPKVYVLAPETGTVMEIDAVQLQVARRCRACSTAVSMQLAPSGDALWVLCTDPPGLQQLPLDSLRPARRIRCPIPESFDLSETGMAAIACAHDRTLVFSPLASGPERTVACADEPNAVRFRKDGRQLLVASRSARALGMFDVATGKLVVRLPLPIEPRHFSGNSDGGQVFLSGAGADAVVVVYPYETEIGETFLAGRAPAAMVVTETPEYLMVSNPDTNSVTVLDFENNGNLVATVEVGASPGQIVLTPSHPGEDQYALVLNEKSGDLAVIRLNTLVNTDPIGRYQPRPVFTIIPVGERPVAAAVVTFS
jgi:DNA-binding beta-propeller fold protein YncE